MGGREGRIAAFRRFYGWGWVCVSGKGERDLPSIIDGTYSWRVYYDVGEIYIHIYISG
jgi:hypothetical protein